MDISGKFIPSLPPVNIWSSLDFKLFQKLNCYACFHFKAMIHELLGTKNNTIDLNGRDDVADELKQLTLSATTDEFYRHNMYANFGEIGQTIQKLVQSFQEKVLRYICSSN